ncbi:unnamed protein product [Vicia faba]|uniref:Uncharacterized protein n=1 Tax=Vicia faba TaxID=3906 RepID=A0AAV0Z0C6_VICFA|nr:unnamed protein product [Vicia faba]
MVGGYWAVIGVAMWCEHYCCCCADRATVLDLAVHVVLCAVCGSFSSVIVVWCCLRRGGRLEMWEVETLAFSLNSPLLMFLLCFVLDLSDETITISISHLQNQVNNKHKKLWCREFCQSFFVCYFSSLIWY